MAKRKKFIITDGMVKNATDYIPYVDKLTIVLEIADDCLEPADQTTESVGEKASIAIPQFYKEKSGAKQYFLMYYFLRRYLNLAIKEEDWNDSEYDFYASSHIFNQLERFKSGDVGIKNKVFDMLYDYKQLKSMLETEIYNLKEVRNSGLDRLQGYLDLFSTPDNIVKLNNLLQKRIGDIEAAQKKIGEKNGTAQVKSKPKEE